MEKTPNPVDPRPAALRPGIAWWLGQLLLTAVALFFVCFGLSLLVACYQLGDPFSFILSFFAACLMTMISLVMVLGLVLRMHRVARAKVPEDPDPDDA